MKHKHNNKLASILLSGAVIAAGTAGYLPGTVFGNLANSVSITASAEQTDSHWSKESYTKTNMNATFVFKVDEAQHTAVITCAKPANASASSLPVHLWFPTTVSVTKNGVKTFYDVTEIDTSTTSSQLAKSVQRLYIPSTVTSIGSFSFNGFSNLNSVQFIDAETNFANSTTCSIKNVGSSAFKATSPFISNQVSQNGFAVVGNCLVYFPASTAATLNLSATKYNSIKYICRNAFSSFTNLKTLYLPRNLKSTSNYVTPSALATIYYWDASTNANRNLKTDIQNNRKSATLNNIFTNCGGIWSSGAYDSMGIGEEISTLLAKKALSNAGVTYKGSVYSGYNAWQQYAIVNKLYKYIGKNYYHYNCLEGKSLDYVSEMLQTECLGYKGSQTAGIQCSDYAEMFKKLCICAGVDAQYVSSKPRTGEDGHAFNIVKIGTEWFNIDSCHTWLGQTYTFMTPDSTLTANLGCHDKTAGKYPVCRRSMGDVNMDGIVDLLDAQLITLTVSNSSNLSSFQKVLCDIDRNGTINSRDAQLAMDYYLVSKTTYPTFEKYYASKYGSFTQFLHS